MWYGGRKLAFDLTLPRLRHKWGGAPDSLTGISMTAETARTVLTSEALRAARSARSEHEFFTLLDHAGLQVRLRSDGPCGATRPATTE